LYLSSFLKSKIETEINRLDSISSQRRVRCKKRVAFSSRTLWKKLGKFVLLQLV